jgi:integral membrane sensor domain MASE1
MNTTREGEYGLRWNPNPPVTIAGLVTVALAAGVYTILSWLGVVGLPMGIAGVSSLFVAIGFGISFAMWFGAWGLLIGYVGTLVGAGLLSGLPVLVALPFGLVDVIQFGVPLLSYRLLAARFGLNPLGQDVYTVKGFLFFFVFGGLIPNGLGAVYGITILLVVGFVPQEAWGLAVLGWWVGNVIVCVIVTPILLSTVTPIIQRFGLATHGCIT